MKQFRSNLRFVAIWMLLFTAATPVLRGDSIVNSKHNLSATGPGTVKAATETEICVFCHTPHHATHDAPLWNRNSSGATYVPYTSSTVKASIGQPTGDSKLCLGCHDGTVALGMVVSRKQQITFQGGVTVMPPGSTQIGTDLSGHHPISFSYDSALASANGQLKDPNTLVGPVRLDPNGQLQCTACHDAHNNQYGGFLVQNNFASALCVTCHDKTYWANTIHRSSPATWNGIAPNPWPHTSETTVMANGCENCHTPHAAGNKPRLLTNAGQEANCYTCHDGNVAAKNIQSEFNKYSVHPIATTSSLHDPTEDPINPSRHVACVDCHNPHAAYPAAATVPAAAGGLAGVKGVNAAGTVINPLVNEYELCFRCHADSTARGPATLTRQFVQTNKRMQFSTANAGYHPVETTGKNANVPSLIAPWTVSSLMYCTDCHNNDQGPGASGTGPNGPHGSVYAPLLERQLLMTDFSTESSGAYALCYKCHSRASILGNQSFPKHNSHVVTDQAACTTCHDSHGVATQPRLINFNTAYVSPNSLGQMSYTSTGVNHGTCSLTCHSYNHNNSSY